MRPIHTLVLCAWLAAGLPALAETGEAPAPAPGPGSETQAAPAPARAAPPAEVRETAAAAPAEPAPEVPDREAPARDADPVEPAEPGEEEPAPLLTLDEAAVLLDAQPPADAEAAAPGAREDEEPITWDSIVIRVAVLAQEAPERLPRFVNGAIDDVTDGRMTRRAQTLAGAVVALAVMLLVLLVRLVRGSGDVVVLLHYPAELKGTFSVRLSSRKARGNRTCRIKTLEDAQRQGASTRTEHHMVSRETSFRNLSNRRVHVSVEGFLQTADGGETLSTHFVETPVRLARGGIQRVEFDLSPRACPVEVRVTWDRRPVEGALVARRGAPGSMRFARGAVHFSLDRGEHVFLVGHADRVCEVPFQVTSLQPVQLEIELSERRHLLFTGCPPAVEPYLNGDVPAAARALEREGQSETAHRILARFHLDQDHTETAAKHFESASDFARAAELQEALHHFEKAAGLYEKAGDHERAAENFRSAGKLLRAGDAYVRADAYDSAVECFKRAGDTARWIEALEKKGSVFEAARVALDQGDRTRAIHCLSRIASGDSDYPEAVVRLAEAYSDQGHVELALHKLDELMATRRDEELRTEGLDRVAKLLEAAGDFQRAVQMLERLRLRDATWPNLATRIEDLRKKASRDLEVSGTPPIPGASVFSQEFRYEILEELGRGGMGIVFKARDRRLGRVVALKRLPDNLRNHPKAVELFLREARAAAALNHPNIVTLFDAGQDGETFYLTMELLEGMPLQRVVAQRGKLAPTNVAKLAGQVATGLEYAHEQGIVHRDIKTANLFFTNKKLVKIMDFGLAKMVEEVRRASTVIGGTPYYMAPEQSAGEAIDRRADIYAFGVTLYELLTGSVPFKDGDVAFHHRHTPPPDLRTLAPEVPAAFAELVAQMLAKKPEDRVANAAIVRERLHELARG
jgi:tetratricopeptide (TPR) repeat protein